jgi:serine/threonine protein kinase
MTSDDSETLPSGYALEEYRIESVLGQGGFGVTYLARDTQLDQQVAIKEYLPSRFTLRDSDLLVRPRSPEAEPIFRGFLQRFLNEARTLAKLRHPNIVRVRRYFAKLGTAYMVMDYEDGTSLAQTLADLGAPPDEPWIRALLVPLLDALDAVHAAQFLHRDIKPANILVRRNGIPLLLDFGSARPVEAAAENLTALYTPRYGAFEQYTGGRREGPWTDIRGMAAVLYRLVAGEAPIDDQQRYEELCEGEPPRPRDPDPLVSAVARGKGRYDGRLLQAIDWGLRLDERARPQSVAEWRLGRGDEVGLHPIADTATATTVTRRVTPGPRATAQGEARRRALSWAAPVVAVAAAAALALLWSAPAPERSAEVTREIAPSPVGVEAPSARSMAVAEPTSDSAIAALGIVDGSDPRYSANPDLLLADLRADARRQAIEKAVGIFVEGEALQSRYASLEH